MKDKDEVVINYMIILGLIILTLFVARWGFERHDRKVKIEVTKTWIPITAIILDAQTEMQYKSGSKGGTSYHCYHIRVGYDFNQIHYTSEIEFLEQCIPNALIGVDFSNIAKYYYPPSHTIQVLVDPNNPKHIRDMGYISNLSNHY